MPEIQIVPAAAGYYALWRWDDGEYVRAIITAWLIEHSGSDEKPYTVTIPLTFGGSDTSDRAAVNAILCPDGSVNDGNGTYWRSLKDWLADRPANPSDNLIVTR